MKVQRFLASNSREALALARAELGAEAVVLSSRQTEKGFELLALAKGDIATLVQAGRESAVQSSPPAGARTFVKPLAAKPAAQAALATPARGSAAVPDAEPRLLDEIRALRGIVEEQGANLAWVVGSDEKRAHARPLRAMLMREMMLAGFSPVLSRKIAEAIPDDFSPETARQWLSQALARNLLCAGAEGDPFERGGVFALVGPTGVGKTTTAAKLAASCVVRHGAASLGMISADHYRIGAQDQLRIYGRILGVPVHAVHDADSLRAALETLAGKRLVLIDSIGVGQRDARVAEQSALFEEQNVSRILLLSAAGQPETLDEVVQAYGAERLAGAILTKVDEAVSLGGAIDCAIRRRLKVSHMTDGQRVPEDIHLAQSSYLVHRSLSARRTPAFQMRAHELDFLAFARPSGEAREVANAGA